MLAFRILTLVRKELQALLRDPSSRRLLIVPVLAQLLIFPYAATLEVRNAAIAVLNEDGGRAASDITQRIAAGSAFHDMRLLTGAGQMQPVIDDQQALLVVRFPPGFSRDIAAGRTAAVQIIGDGRRTNSAQLATAYVQQIVAGYAAEQPRTPPRAAAPVIRNWYNPNLEASWFIVPSLVDIISTVGCLVVTSLSVAREREQGTLDQLFVSPLSPAVILAGKAIPAILIAAMQASIIVLTAVFWFGIPLTGSLLLLYAGLLLYALALAGFGLFISAISETQQQAFLGVFSFMLPAVLLSGFVSPVENMPRVLQWVSWIDPLRHFIVMVEGLFLKSHGWPEFLSHAWPLATIAAVTLGATYLKFRKGAA